MLNFDSIAKLDSYSITNIGLLQIQVNVAKWAVNLNGLEAARQNPPVPLYGDSETILLAEDYVSAI